MSAQPLGAPAAEPFLRDAERRLDAGLWDALDAEPHTRVLLAKRGALAMVGQRVFWALPEQAPAGERCYLGTAVQLDGIEAGQRIELRLLADDAELDADLQAAGAEWQSLRALVRALGAEQLELAATAIALANWRSSHRHCPRCGGPLGSAQAGWALNCSDCGNQVFPRTDPAVIVRVVDDAGRILLGSNAAWEHNRYSLLAGFVEPGESLEQAVLREVFEESGVEVAEPRYLDSQAWPFPLSLMLGFEARALSEQLRPDGEEIVDLRWFDREQILGTDIILPGPGSLARRIVEDWFGAPLPDSPPLL